MREKWSRHVARSVVAPCDEPRLSVIASESGAPADEAFAAKDASAGARGEVDEAAARPKRDASPMKRQFKVIFVAISPT